MVYTVHEVIYGTAKKLANIYRSDSYFGEKVQSMLSHKIYGRSMFLKSSS
jgi:hypothetical protein